MSDDLTKYRKAIERMGEFGQLFIDYIGCPRGGPGRECAPLTEELLSMPVLTDVDGGRWRPVNEEALQEAITLLKEKGKGENENHIEQVRLCDYCPELHEGSGGV